MIDIPHAHSDHIRDVWDIQDQRLMFTICSISDLSKMTIHNQKGGKYRKVN